MKKPFLSWLENHVKTIFIMECSVTHHYAAQLMEELGKFLSKLPLFELELKWSSQNDFFS